MSTYKIVEVDTPVMRTVDEALAIFSEYLNMGRDVYVKDAIGIDAYTFDLAVEGESREWVSVAYVPHSAISKMDLFIRLNELCQG